MDPQLRDQLTVLFESYVTQHKQDLISKVLHNRTRFLTVVLEDIFKPHNASAVIRTCECLGIQDLHVVEKVNQYTPNPYVTKGATKWVSIFQYEEPVSCLSQLKEKGYRIVVTTPDKNAVDFRQYPLDQKTAIVFGTEFSGVSNETLHYADELIYIPMFGFTESLNISVSAAIILHDLNARLRNFNTEWQLNEEEIKELRLSWYRNIVKRSALLEEEFLNGNS